MKLLIAMWLSILAATLPYRALADEAEPSKQAHEETQTAASPKKPWGDFTVSEEKEGRPWWTHVLLWLPNRAMDLVDVVRADVGAGVSYGAVVRVSKYAQAGYRQQNPVSVRVGLFGRKAPFLAESSNEFGIGPGYVLSSDRIVCPGEVGVGADLLIVGAYGGVCMEELFDFVAGIFFLDVLDDDIK